MGSNATDEPGLRSWWSRKRFVIDGFRRSVPLFLAATAAAEPPDLPTLLRQPVKIDATIVVGEIDLTAIDHRRVELVEEKLNVPLLRIPQNFQ